jgi:hypothetical protein
MEKQTFMPKKSKIFFFTVLFLTMGLILTLADLFSSVITVGNFAFLPSQSVKTSSYKIYAISLQKSSTYNQASTQLQDIKMRGGAGVIYQTDGLYYCLASAYENENDAYGVQNNLKENKTDSEIVVISINSINFDLTLSGTEKNALLDAVNSFKTVFKTLYDISISLDTGVKDFPTCKLDAALVKDKFFKTKKNFDEAFKTKLSNEIFQTKLKLVELSNSLNVLTELDRQEKVLFSSTLKETYINAILQNKTLASEITQ